jgi:hypothetical protein
MTTKQNGKQAPFQIGQQVHHISADRIVRTVLWVFKGATCRADQEAMMRGHEEATIDLMNSEARLKADNDRLRMALDDIGRLALLCWMDMQGRLEDDQHKRAHQVLGNIVKSAADAVA